MKFHLKEEKDRLVVSFEGEIDLESSGEARKVLLDCVSRGRSILVDMSGVTLIDSSGVAVLLEAFQETRKKGKEYALAGVGDSVLRVLKLAHLETFFTITDNAAQEHSESG